MADTKSQEFQQKIILILEEQMKNQGQILRSIKGSNTALNQYNKTKKIAAKTTQQWGKSLIYVGKALRAVNAVLSTGVAVIGGLVAAFTVLSKSGKHMTQFAAQTGKGSEAIKNLRASYSGFVQDSNKVNISLQDTVKAMAGFGSQGFAQLMMSSEQATQKFVASLQNSLTQGLGSQDVAAELTQSVTKAFGDNLSALRSFREQWLAAGGDMEKQAQVMSRFQWIDPEVMKRATGAMTNMLETAQGKGDPAIKLFLRWQEIMNQLEVAISNLRDKFIEVWGDDISGFLVNISSHMTDFLKGLDDAYYRIEGIGLRTAALIENLSAAATFGIVGDMQDIGEVQNIYRYKKMLEEQAEFSRQQQIKSQQKITEVAKQAIGPARDFTQEMKETYESLNSTRDALLINIQESENWSKSLEKISKSVQTVDSLIRLIGPNMKVGGKALQQLSGENIARSVSQAAKLLESSGAKSMQLAEDQIKIVKDLLDNAKKQKETTDVIGGLEQQLNNAIAERDKLIENNLQAYQELEKSQNAILAANEADLSIIERQRSILERQMDISQNLYGSAALAVEAQLKIVEKMQQEKDLLIDMLSRQQQYVGLLEAQGIAGEQLLFAKQKQLELEEKIFSKTSEQVQLIKQLKDGYLDAVQASAFSAGRFEKILIDQEKNLGMALDKNIAKKNILLGQTGKDAARASVDPFRFSAQGMGMLESLNGQSTNALERNQQFVNNIADANARALAQYSQDIFGQVPPVVNENTAAINRNTDVLNQYINKGLKAAGTIPLRGTAAGDVAVGGAVGGRLSGVPQLRAIDVQGGGGKVSPAVQKEQQKLMRYQQKYDAINKRIQSLQSSDSKMITIGNKEHSLSAGKADVHGFDMRSSSEIKRARSTHAAMIRGLENQRDALTPRIANQKMRVKSALSRTSVSSNAGGAGKNLAQKFMSVISQLSPILSNIGDLIDSASNQEPDQISDHQGRFSNTILGGK